MSESLESIFQDKTIKAKAKVSQIGGWLIDGSLPIEELLSFADSQTKVNKASCIEAIEYATRKQPEIANQVVFSYVTKALLEEEPRIKWESAKVIGNTVKLFHDLLEEAIQNLLSNINSDGTVVRWATAYALGEILKLKTKHNTKLLPFIEKLSEKEEDNGVRNKYIDAIKKARK